MRKRVLPSEDTLSANSSAAAAAKCFTPRSTPRNTVIATGAAIRPTIGGSESTAKYTVRIWSVSAAAKNSHPNVQVPAIAATPVDKKTIENVLQISCLVVDSTLFSSYCKSIHFGKQILSWKYITQKLSAMLFLCCQRLSHGFWGKHSQHIPCSCGQSSKAPLRADTQRGALLEQNLSTRQNQHKKKTAQATTKDLPKRFLAGAPSGTRTQDPLIKSQLLYQLS